MASFDKLSEINYFGTFSSSNGFTCLNLAVEQGLTPTVDYLCKLGANLNHPNPNTGLPPLWTSLERGDYGTAEVLVGHGCDMEGWAMSDDSQLEETLLHRAIDNCNQKAAVFLIKRSVQFCCCHWIVL